MKPTHYVYHNWHLHKAILHHGTCPSCNDGQGIHEDKTGENSEWLGFPDREAAQAFVNTKEAEGYRNTEVCGTCAGAPYEPESVSSSLVSRPKGRISRRAARY